MKSSEEVPDDMAGLRNWRSPSDIRRGLDRIRTTIYRLESLEHEVWQLRQDLWLDRELANRGTPASTARLVRRLFNAEAKNLHDIEACECWLDAQEILRNGRK